MRSSAAGFRREHVPREFQLTRRSLFSLDPSGLLSEFVRRLLSFVSYIANCSPITNFDTPALSKMSNIVETIMTSPTCISAVQRVSCYFRRFHASTSVHRRRSARFARKTSNFHYVQVCDGIETFHAGILRAREGERTQLLSSRRDNSKC